MVRNLLININGIEEESLYARSDAEARDFRICSHTLLSKLLINVTKQTNKKDKMFRVGGVNQFSHAFVCS